MQEVAETIIKGILKACSMSDSYTIELGKEYKKDPLLRFFNVPYIKPKSINLDLKFAIKAISAENLSPSEGGSFSEEAYKKCCAKIFEFFKDHEKNLFDKDAKEEDINTLLSAFKEIMDSKEAKMISRVNIKNFELITTSLIASAREDFLSLLLASGTTNLSAQYLSDFFSEKEGEYLKAWDTLHSDLIAVIHQEVGIDEDKQTENIGFIFTSERLANIEAEKINSMHLSFEVHSKEWTRIDRADGTSFEKLS